MHISGIRYKIKQENDARQTAIFTKYLVYYLRVFATLGVILPSLLAIDYIVKPKIESEIIIQKHIVRKLYGNTFCQITTANHQLIVDIPFYMQVEEGRPLVLEYTRIFSHLKRAVFYNGNTYTYHISSIYGGAGYLLATNFICSLIFLLKKRKRKGQWIYMADLGVVNAFLCLIVIVFIIHYS